MHRKFGIADDKIFQVKNNINQDFMPKDIDYFKSDHAKELQSGKCLIIKFQNEHIIDDVLKDF